MADGKRRFKDEIYGHFARLGKAVSSPRRIELLDVLAQGPRTVEALANEVGQGVASTSHHLQSLKAARLVHAERRGTFRAYHLAGDEVASFVLGLRRLAESHLAEVEQVTRDFHADRQELERVEVDALLERARAGQVLVLDVRPRCEYAAGHLPGALNVPIDELEGRLAKLPDDRKVVAYCRGPYCVMAFEAVELLSARGFDAAHCPGGVVELRERGVTLGIEGPP